MSIRDNRVLLDDADATTNWVDQAGGTMNLVASTNRIQGANSVSQQVSSDKLGTLYDAATNQDWSGSVFYVWWNVTTSNLLADKSSGGVAMRFTANTITDYFEIYLDGADTYSGGWRMAVVDIDEAWQIANSSPNAAVGAIGGAGARPNLIRRVGMVFDVTGMIPGSDENTFVDAIWQLPIGEPGIIVSGKNHTPSPAIPWTWQDIVDAGDIADTAKAWGTITQADGVIKLNTPVQFGAGGLGGVEGATESPDPGDHSFEDTNKVIAWESKLVQDSFYGFTVFGDTTNVQNFKAGVSNGDVGSQGWVITAAPDGPRWYLECSSVYQDATLFAGCTMQHSSWIDIDNVNVDFLNNVLVDGQRLIHGRG